MREQFFIDLRRREEAQARRVARRSEPVFSMEDKRISVFEPSDFPGRECRSVRGPIHRVSFTAGIIANPNYHFALYDEKGICREGARTFREALRRRKEDGLYIARLIW